MYHYSKKYLPIVTFKKNVQKFGGTIIQIQLLGFGSGPQCCKNSMLFNAINAGAGNARCTRIRGKKSNIYDISWRHFKCID